jgi:hypothetical protein
MQLVDGGFSNKQQQSAMLPARLAESRFLPTVGTQQAIPPHLPELVHACPY